MAEDKTTEEVVEETTEVVADEVAEPAKKPAAKKASPKDAAGEKKAPAKKPAAKKDDAKEAPKKAAKKSEPAAEQKPVRAVAKYVRVAPRKARLIADLIRDKDVAQARSILALSTRSAAENWSLVLESAVANAENNHNLIGDELKIHSITADEGPTIKRFQPRAHGRAYPILKRTSHLTVQLTTKEND